MTYKNQMVKDIVLEVPGSDELFKQNRIDFCCGGNRPLEEAVKEKGLNQAEIDAELDRIAEQTQVRKDFVDFQWQDLRSEKLIDHIVYHHHAFLQKDLPELEFYVTKIARVHGGDQPFLIELHNRFMNLKEELTDHLKKEEEILFPAIIEFEEKRSDEALTKAAARLDELESEHSGAGELLHSMRALTSDYSAPETACTTFRMTFNRLEQLESDLFQHIHLENNILFARVAAAAAQKA
ncbi:iron-sulfur cluster repair di-iron protein [Salisediminibacterium halotolerans]|uniref:Regulator of cell morphogenesis and NO signaling n=1 Tax=Salisediminibacterium halotolerans TaxID=517425 RepID=A0A1H9R6W8_9BACI|nr:iron-sulfur cluster repair di-iron protein [Salisediminibacterium haloalkalitolerans]SER68440.1 regulator of cell morphogenesis and NO signaling [Salisediminibacterium haloalkalitolerans]